MEIQLGCLNRPWHEHTLEEALAGIAAGGYATVGFTGQQGKPTLSADCTDEQLARIGSLLRQHNLRAQVWIGQPDVYREAEEAVRRFQREIAHAEQLGLRYAILCGTAEESKYEHWYALVERCLDYAQEHQVMLLLKPHGGISALAEDLLRARQRLAHPSFGICYDPGNIYYYTGRPAEEDLPKVASHVKAMCIKDEVNGKHGEVMITPGTGLVDFRRIFAMLADVGFSGPCWVECLGGKSLAEINEEAKKTYQFIAEIAANT